MTIDMRPGLSGLTPEALDRWVAEQGQPAYRARQIADAVWKDGGVASAAEILTLPSSVRDGLDAGFSLDTVADTELRIADGGQTEKALHRLSDGALIESVRSAPPANWVLAVICPSRRSWTRPATPPVVWP